MNLDEQFDEFNLHFEVWLESHLSDLVSFSIEYTKQEFPQFKEFLKNEIKTDDISQVDPSVIVRYMDFKSSKLKSYPEHERRLIKRVLGMYLTCLIQHYHQNLGSHFVNH